MRARSLAALALLVLAACQPKLDLPQLFPVPNASLLDETGKRVQLDAMKGSVTVYDFIFTSCTGVCPIMTNNMRELTPRVDKEAPVRFVSISVDPARATRRPSLRVTLPVTATIRAGRFSPATGRPSSTSR